MVILGPESEQMICISFSMDGLKITVEEDPFSGLHLQKKLIFPKFAGITLAFIFGIVLVAGVVPVLVNGD